MSGSWSFTRVSDCQRVLCGVNTVLMLKFLAIRLMSSFSPSMYGMLMVDTGGSWFSDGNFCRFASQMKWAG